MTWKATNKRTSLISKRPNIRKKVPPHTVGLFFCSIYHPYHDKMLSVGECPGVSGEFDESLNDYRLSLRLPSI